MGNSGILTEGYWWEFLSLVFTVIGQLGGVHRQQWGFPKSEMKMDNGNNYDFTDPMLVASEFCGHFPEFLVRYAGSLLDQ